MTTEIVLHDIADGSETVVHTSAALIEAPNWSPDGRFLLVNSGGLMFRIELSAPEELRRVETGPLVACNNDHGISPDGKTLMISDSPGRGTSCIFSIPLSGGQPKQISRLVPSYWHGWSPDGQTIAYTARRGGAFHICTMPAEGGPEYQLTQGPGHRDGPDFTPDGEWIWFNAEYDKKGADLWRMKTDGSQPQRMTFDGRVNWFPHPSPDGKEVLFLSYPPGTRGHPANLPVELRLMDPEGGNIRTIAVLRGGQGSINVPCWAPDSRRFAYARYPKT